MKTHEEGYALGWADAIYAYESRQRKKMSTLPPLPELKGSIVVDGERYTFDVIELLGTELRAYGEACAAAEREECAKVCDEMVLYTGFDCAVAIRARGETLGNTPT